MSGFRNGWLAGEVCAKTGPVSYEVNVDGQVWKLLVDQLLSQSGSNYQPPDAHVPTEMDGGLPFLADLPGLAQSAVEQAAPNSATRGPMEGPEVTSAEQGHSGLILL